MKDFISVLCPTTAQLKEVQEFMTMENVSYEDVVNEINCAIARRNKCEINMKEAKVIVELFNNNSDTKVEYAVSDDRYYFNVFLDNNNFDFSQVIFSSKPKISPSEGCEILTDAIKNKEFCKNYIATQNEILLKTLEMIFGTIHVNGEYNIVWLEDYELYIDDISNIKINSKTKIMTFNYLDDTDEIVKYILDLNTGIIL